MHTAARAADLANNGAALEAWEAFGTIPAGAHSFPAAREMLLPYTKTLAMGMMEAGSAAQTSGNDQGASSLFETGKLLNPQVSEPPPVAQTRPKVAETNASPRRSRAHSQRVSQPGDRAKRLFLSGDLEGAVDAMAQTLEAAGSRQDKHDLIQSLENYRQIKEIGARARAFRDSGQPAQAMVFFQEARRRAENVDRKAGSPITQKLRADTKAVGYQIARGEIAKGNHQAFERASATLRVIAPFATGDPELAQLQRQLDRGPAADCYKTVYAKHLASPMNLDRTWAVMTLNQCMRLSSSGMEYHDKSKALLAKVNL